MTNLENCQLITIFSRIKFFIFGWWEKQKKSRLPIFFLLFNFMSSSQTIFSFSSFTIYYYYIMIIIRKKSKSNLRPRVNNQMSEFHICFLSLTNLLACPTSKNDIKIDQSLPFFSFFALFDQKRWQMECKWLEKWRSIH